jgi:hemerythrin
MMTGTQSDEVFFEWTPDYSVHVEAIDKQHQELIGILNRLFVAVSEQESVAGIEYILDELVKYTQFHFELEEGLMQRANYPEFEAHRQTHKKLIQQLSELRDKVERGEEHLYFEILGFVKDWLRGHILDVDRQYSPAMKQAGLANG